MPLITKYLEYIQNLHLSGVTIFPSVHRRMPLETRISSIIIEQNQIFQIAEVRGDFLK
ncbi:MAG TPA: hypothetical protein O0W81_02595 [Methanocorpusculum sp.]|nr:hypothetical protein [Methanocorpusculum sp.]